MKKLSYLVTGLALTLCLAGCGGAQDPVSNPSGGNTSTDSHTPTTNVTVYLVLGDGGLYNGQAGSDELIDDFNVVKFTGQVGADLPDANAVTNTDTNKTFNGWFLNGAPTSKIVAANDVYYAQWQNSGTTSEGGGEESTTSEGGGGEASGFYVVGSFGGENKWSADKGYAMTWASENIASAVVTFAVGDQFKINNPSEGSTGSWAGSWHLVANSAFKAAGTGPDENVECISAGTYRVSYNISLRSTANSALTLSLVS